MRTVYLDNAATTAVKPREVIDAAERAIRCYTANPGRSGYELAVKCSEAVYSARRSLADFFGLDDPSRVIFTSGCTQSVNMAVRGSVQSGDHIVISDLEHNAVARTVHDMASQGVSCTAAHVFEGDRAATAESFAAAIRPNTRMVVCTHASNVFGTVLPIEEISALCRRKKILFCVDCAQTAGVLPLEVSRHCADMLCIPSHKGLYGLCGAGALILCSGYMPRPVVTGGTGSLSASLEQPDELPDRLESGTLNTAGILTMAAGAEWIKSVGMERIYTRELELARMAYDGLERIRGVRLYTERPRKGLHVPVVSFNIDGIDSERTAEYLSGKGIAVRAGYHCAYQAHKTYGTQKTGTVRVSPGWHNSADDIDCLLRAIAAF